MPAGIWICNNILADIFSPRSYIIFQDMHTRVVIEELGFFFRIYDHELQSMDFDNASTPLHSSIFPLLLIQSRTCHGCSQWKPTLFVSVEGGGVLVQCRACLVLQRSGWIDLKAKDKIKAVHFSEIARCCNITTLETETQPAAVGRASWCRIPLLYLVGKSGCFHFTSVVQVRTKMDTGSFPLFTAVLSCLIYQGLFFLFFKIIFQKQFYVFKI